VDRTPNPVGSGSFVGGWSYPENLYVYVPNPFRKKNSTFSFGNFYFFRIVPVNFAIDFTHTVISDESFAAALLCPFFTLP
jgi:hypothetical protein